MRLLFYWSVFAALCAFSARWMGISARQDFTQRDFPEHEYTQVARMDRRPAVLGPATDEPSENPGLYRGLGSNQKSQK